MAHGLLFFRLPSGIVPFGSHPVNTEAWVERFAPEFAAIGQGSRVRRIAQAAHVTAEVHRRTGRFARVLREAAPSDDSIAEMLRSTRERQRLDIAAGAELLLGRPPTSLELDGLWATLSPEMYLLLVEDSGWAVEQYQSWVAQTLDSHVPEP